MSATLTRLPARSLPVLDPRTLAARRADVMGASPRHGERATLNDLIVGVWEALSRHHAAACPVCGEGLEPLPAAGPAVVAGCCRGCGSVLR
jgi:hypothetical protein